MVLVGFESTAKNFRLYDSHTRKVIMSCEVVFNEKPIKIGAFHDDENDFASAKIDEDLSQEHICSTPNSSMKNELSSSDLTNTPTNSSPPLDVSEEPKRYCLRKEIVAPRRLGIDHMGCLASMVEPES